MRRLLSLILLLAGLVGAAQAQVTYKYPRIRTDSLVVTNGAVFDTNTLAIDNTRNRVGIGTATPFASLSVVNGLGDAAVHIGRYADNGLFLHSHAQSTHYNWLISTQDAATGVLEIKPSTTVGGKTWASAVLSVTQTGRVGINTVTPAYAFDVTGTGRFTGNLTGDGIITVNGGGQSFFNGGFKSLNAAVFEAAVVSVDGGMNNSPGLTLRGTYDSNTTTAVASSTYDAAVRHAMTAAGATPASRLQFEINGSTLAALQSDGSMGIGTATPAEPLHVYTSASSVMRLESSTSTAGLSFRDPEGGATFWWDGPNTFTFGTVAANVSGKMLHVDGGMSVGSGALSTAPPVDGLLLSGNFALPASAYANWGTTYGATGYGLRDNAGTMEYKNSGGTWTSFGSLVGGTPGGSDTQVQFNSAGAFGGDAGLTYNAANDDLSVGRNVTLAGQLGQGRQDLNGSATWNLNLGAMAFDTLKANTSIALSNPLEGASYVFLAVQDATGGRTLTLGGAEVPVDFTPLSSTIITCSYLNTRYNCHSWWKGRPVDFDEVTTTTYTLALADLGKIKQINNAANVTVSIPDNATAAFPLGSTLRLQQTGAGQIVLDPATGVTLNGGTTNVSITAGQYHRFVTLYKSDTDPNIWYVEYP